MQTIWCTNVPVNDLAKWFCYNIEGSIPLSLSLSLSLSVEHAQLYLTAYWQEIGGKEQHLLQVVLLLPSTFCGQQPK